MTNSLWFENLAAASFLSPSGQCKPFDADADGYCRGEGFAAVMVKKMSDALADGDVILGTISGSGVLQNQNCTPIFVPNQPSLSDLFSQVLDQAQLSAREITFVEAHGTGTQVGDPAEYSGIRAVLGGSARQKSDKTDGELNSNLSMGSVKGLVGHTECSSGAVSLVKTLLMGQHKLIPPQASFKSINRAIQASPDDNMEVVTRLKRWQTDDGFHASLINNYGASGSNASMVVTEAPKLKSKKRLAYVDGNSHMDYPFRICGYDERAVKAYCERLKRFLASKSPSELAMADLSFNVARQTNPTLEKQLVFSSRSVDQLIELLNTFHSANGSNNAASSSRQPQIVSRNGPPTPVVLCFGGQVSTFVGLDQEIYHSNKILRKHLHTCDDVLRAATDIGSIFPAIFQCTPINDPVQLQTMLFALQYACAMSWISCGIEPVALVGHSFGELTALCVSGIISLHDAVQLVAGRATIIRESWGDDKGAMMAVEGDLAVVDDLLRETSGSASIACYNGARSFTLAGTVAEIDEVARLLESKPTGSIKSKRLDVTNAFHSALVEPLVPRLAALGEELSFKEPKIPLETATKFPLASKDDDGKNNGFTSRYVADHLREPVYFDHAVRRLASKYPSAVFLEAGSNSTVTVMASRALSSNEAGAGSQAKFQSVDITFITGRGNGNAKGSSNKGMQALTHVTLTLWKYGLNKLVFWPHHRNQTYEYTPVILPPYQFDKSRHWLDMKAPPRAVEQVADNATTSALPPPPPPGLFSLVESKEKRSARLSHQHDWRKLPRFCIGSPHCPNRGNLPSNSDCTHGC